MRPTMGVGRGTSPRIGAGDKDMRVLSSKHASAHPEELRLFHVVVIDVVSSS